MTTIGFFLQNPDLGDIDCTSLLSGNPGIGGTEYEFLLVSSELARRYPDEFSIRLFTIAQFVPPPAVRLSVIDDCPESLFEAAESSGCDLLVLDAKLERNWFSCPFGSFLFVAWGHLFSNHKKLSRLASNPKVVRYVCVGREQLELLLDHDIYRKGTYIYNACPFDASEFPPNPLPVPERRHSVAFVGSLSESKGFHYVSRIWKKVLLRVPDAELHVLGAGSLYAKGSKLGSRGIAEERYEERILPPLLCEDGRIHPSVHFHGVLHGPAKWQILCSCKVGVINPNTDETFGLSAVDLQLAGTWLVARASPGVMDTAGHARFTYRNRNALADRIVDALMATAASDSPQPSEIEKRFGMDAVANRWHDELLGALTGKNPEHEFSFHHLAYREKWLRCLNRLVRFVFPFVPPVLRCEEILSTILKKVAFRSSFRTHSIKEKECE